MAEPIRKITPEEDPAPEREPRLIGKPFRRVDGRAKVTGATRFADDLSFPRMCWVRLVRSTVPHAVIRSIDLGEAEKVPGVLGFLTGKDFPIPFGILPVSQDEHALCPDKVRFVGDPVVAVALDQPDEAGVRRTYDRGRYLGTGMSARMVGWAMNAAHTDKKIPAHRVVNSQGLLTGKHHFSPPSSMQKRLEAEGTKVVKDKVQDFSTRFWDPSIELL